MVLVMTVNPGFGGQAYIATMEPKIAEVRAMIDAARPRRRLEVDGGIGPATIAGAAAAGADVLVAGSALFRDAEGLAHAVTDLRTPCRGRAVTRGYLGRAVAVALVAAIASGALNGCAQHNGDQAAFCQQLPKAPTFESLLTATTKGTDAQAVAQLDKAARSYRSTRAGRAPVDPPDRRTPR